jgi:hypothetical protein
MNSDPIIIVRLAPAAKRRVRSPPDPDRTRTFRRRLAAECPLACALPERQIAPMNERSISRPQLLEGRTSILSPAFRYVPAVKTDPSKTHAPDATPSPAPRSGVATVAARV